MQINFFHYSFKHLQPVAETLTPDPVVEFCGLHSTDAVIPGNANFLLHANPSLPKHYHQVIVVSDIV